jgi:CubicO group peptidase (beta-lactamase class C family)
MHPTLQGWRASRDEYMLSFSGKIIGAFDTPLVFEPGTAWAYGASYEWAGLLVARLTKIRFGAYYEQNIFTPLGMTSTFFGLELRPDLQEKLVVMCTRNGDKLVTGGYGLPDPPQDDIGGVGLYSTVPDFMKLLTELLQDHPKTLKLEIVDLLFTPQLEEDGIPMQAMKAIGPLL